VQDSTAVFLISFCAENPPHRQAEKRCTQFQKVTAKLTKKFIMKQHPLNFDFKDFEPFMFKDVKVTCEKEPKIILGKLIRVHSTSGIDFKPSSITLELKSKKTETISIMDFELIEILNGKD
jgi:hypothetical protein